MNNKNYQSLIDNRIFIGGAADVKEIMKNDKVDVIYDLRAESLEHDAPEVRVHTPIVDDAENQDESIENAINEVIKSYKEGKKIYFHCAGGSNRTGTIAIGTLLALGEADSIAEAEEKAKAARAKINVKPEMKASLQRLFPEA
ncbi:MULTISPECIES: dual specificity protein phosphatase family protein [Priestia]|uniref:protein-tyrosine phosphatase family protein n=1 Tax=Priestia TaxID=2800373 RepID=UPI00064AD61E|nr:dual specificity protein phosphatase family protein [Priestia megaterium]